MTAIVSELKKIKRLAAQIFGNVSRVPGVIATDENTDVFNVYNSYF